MKILLHTSKNTSFFLGISIFLLLATGGWLSAVSLAHAATVKAPSTVGLIGYWPFEDNGGTKANDMSGNRNTGTLVNSPVWTSNGKSGKGIFFNGLNTSGSYVSIPTTGASASAGSISFWAYATTSQTTGGYLLNTTGTGERIYFNYAIGNSVSFVLGSTAVGIGSAATPLGKWHHVVGEWSGTTGTLYVDGAFVASTAFAGLVSVLNPMFVGSFGGTQGFNGIIDEVRFYNRAISASEVKSLYQYGIAKTQTVQAVGSLVGYWPLNDGAGTKANDMSGNRNTGTLFGSPSWPTGKLGKGLNFNASSNYIKVSSFPLAGIQKVSVSYWYKVPPPSGSTYQMMELSADANANPDGSFWQFAYSDSSVYQATKFVTAVYGVGPLYSTATYTAPSPGWHFFTFLYDRTKASQQLDSVYVDGVSQTLTYVLTNLAAGTTFKTYDLYIGARGGTSFFQSGIMDDIHIYSRILSPTEIVNAYKQGASTINTPTNNFLTSGLTGLWSFDGKDMNWNTNKALDRSGNGNDGALTNMSTSTSPVPGKIGQALNFDGTSSYISVGAPASLDIINAITLSAWVKSPSWHPTAVWRSIFDKSTYGLYIQPSSNAVRFQLNITGVGLTSLDTSALNTNQWYHVVGTYDKDAGSNNFKIYVNGVAQNQGTQTNTIVASSNLNIGLYSGAYFNGTMDDLRVYNRALSASEVKQLYNVGK